MANVIVLERFAWFHRQSLSGRYPNAGKLAQRFEISVRTAKRDIAFMRDRLDAPLEYDPVKRGFFYTDPSYELPQIPVTQEELLAILIAKKLLSNSSGGLIADAIRTFGKKFFAGIESFGLSENRIDDAFSASWHGFNPVPENIFRITVTALYENRLLEIDYCSPLSSEPTRRTVEPHHLQHYMASWVLVAWCRMREQWRKFHLSRMAETKILEERFEPRPRDQWQPLVEGAFGIFQGEDHVPVTLRFNPFRARWVRNQCWHPDQVIVERKDGSLDLTFPVADFREVKMMILQFGADVEVAAPEELRREVAAEALKTAALYRPISHQPVPASPSQPRRSIGSAGKPHPRRKAEKPSTQIPLFPSSPRPSSEEGN